MTPRRLRFASMTMEPRPFVTTVTECTRPRRWWSLLCPDTNEIVDVSRERSAALLKQIADEVAELTDAKKNS